MREGRREGRRRGGSGKNERGKEEVKGEGREGKE